MTADNTLDTLLKQHRPEQANLMAVLHDVVHHYGYVPEQVIEPIAEYLGITPPVVYGIMTYYNDFKPSRPAQAIVSFCAGVACRMGRIAQMQRRFEETFGVLLGQLSEDNRVELRAFECFGACALAPLINLDGEYLRNVSDADIDRIIADLQSGRVGENGDARPGSTSDSSVGDSHPRLG
jgi:NADH-quinone oxidoreductase subunit E